MKHALGLMLGALLLCGMVNLAAQAQTYHVSPAGDDGADGSAEAPFRTPAKAVSVLQPGVTVLLYAGEYPGGLSLSPAGTAEQPVVLKAAGDGEVRLQGRYEQKRGFSLVEGTRFTYQVPEDGEVAAVAVDYPDSRLIIDGLGRVGSREEVEQRHATYFHDREAGMLYLRYLSDHPERGHTVWVFRDGSGLSVGGSHVVVEGLTLSHFGSQGVSVGGRHVTIRGCRVSHCGFGWGGGFSLYRAEDARLEDCQVFRVMNGFLVQDAVRMQLNHNTVYATRAHGVILNGGLDNSIRNNILVAGGRSGSCVYVGRGAAAGLTLDYNCYLDSGTAMLLYWVPAGRGFPTFWDYRLAVPDQDANSISDDPRFVSTHLGTEDFRLQPDSPCRGRAENGGDLGVRFGQVMP